MSTKLDRRARARRSLIVLSVVVVALLASIIALTSSNSPRSGAPSRSTTTTQHSPTTSTSTSVLPVTSTTRAPSTTTTVTAPASSTTTTTPSSLRPTRNQPSYSDAALSARFAPLFGAIVHNTRFTQQPLFFPEEVYVKMKTGILPNPASDYVFRLLAFYTLDVAAYHQHLGPSFATATLVTFHAAPHSAQWIPAGTCENNFGYWHVANVRMVYKVGTVKSVAIASLISWHGEWYVVHLGPNPRASNVGTVALAANGPGTPGPSGGC